MNPKQLLEDLKSGKLKEFRAENGQGLRYKSGNFELLCNTCTVEKWDRIDAERYAIVAAERLLK